MTRKTNTEYVNMAQRLFWESSNENLQSCEVKIFKLPEQNKHHKFSQ